MRWRRRGPVEPRVEFAGAVREACMRLGLTVHDLTPEVVTVGGRLSGTVALADLRAACDLLPSERWPGVVVDALQGLALSVEAGVDLADERAAQPLLRTRVYTDGALLTEDVVRRPLAQGLSEVLVAEVGGAVRTLPPAAVHGWSLGEPALLDRGRAQVRAAGPLTATTVDLGGVQVLALESPSPYAATHSCWLSDYVEPAPAGLLVALPTRHLVLCAPLRTRPEALAAAQALLVNADQLWRTGPGGLSPDLWWARDGVLTLLPGTPTSLTPPVAFLEVLDALPG